MNEKPVVRFIYADLDNLLHPSSEITTELELAVARAFKDVAPDDSLLKNATVEEIAEVYARARAELGSDAMHFPFIYCHFKVEETAKLNSAGRTAYHRAKFGLMRTYPNVIPVIVSTRERGLRWGIITNGPEAKQWDKINILGLVHLVEPVVVSEVIAKGYQLDPELAKKPNEIVYEEAVRAVNARFEPKKPLRAGEVLYLDDRLDGIMGANRAGMHTVWIPQGKYSAETPEQVAQRLGEAVSLVQPHYRLSDISELVPIVLPEFKLRRL